MAEDEAAEAEGEENGEQGGENSEAESQGEEAEASAAGESAESENAESVDTSDWRSPITDAAARKEAERSTDLNEFALRVVDLRKNLSKAVVVPGKSASKDEVAAFRKATNVPEQSSDYSFQIPEGMGEADFAGEDVKARLAGFAEMAHSLNLSQDAYSGIMSWYFQETAAAAEAITAEDKAFADEGVASLRKKWGPNFDKEKAFSDRGAAFAFGEAFDAFSALLDGNNKLIGDHPVVIEAMNKIGRAVSEDSVGSFPVEAEAVEGLKEELASLTEQQSDAMARGEHNKAKALDTKIMAVATKISGDNPIVGDGATA